MRHNIKVIESPDKARTPYQEIAIYVRDLLDCDYALVALPDKDSICIPGFVGRDGQTQAPAAAELIGRLQDWGPVVVDEARLIAVPVTCRDRIAGVLIGYSSRPGTFTAIDQEKLMTYSYVAAGILTNADKEPASEARTTFTTNELLHFSRLITIGELSACFSHEVTNPLALIKGHIRFIDEVLDAGHPLRAHFEAIDRASRRIEEMSKHMLDFSKKKSSQTGQCDLGDVVSEALRLVQPYLRSNFVDLQLRIEPDLPPVWANRCQIVQAIVNLLQNAGDALAEAERRVLSVTARMEMESVQIAVSDTGPGVAPGNLPRIFEPFFTTKGERGTGLGLYIAKQVISEHRGTLDVQTSSSGTTFIISLPL